MEFHAPILSLHLNQILSLMVACVNCVACHLKVTFKNHGQGRGNMKFRIFNSPIKIIQNNIIWCFLLYIYIYLYESRISLNWQLDTNPFRSGEIAKINIISPNKIFFIHTIKDWTPVSMFKRSNDLSIVLSLIGDTFYSIVHY